MAQYKKTSPDEPGNMVWVGILFLWLASGTENLTILFVLGSIGALITLASFPRISGWVKRLLAR